MATKTPTQEELLELFSEAVQDDEEAQGVLKAWYQQQVWKKVEEWVVTRRVPFGKATGGMWRENIKARTNPDEPKIEFVIPKANLDEWQKRFPKLSKNHTPAWDAVRPIGEIPVLPVPVSPHEKRMKNHKYRANYYLYQLELKTKRSKRLSKYKLSPFQTLNYRRWKALYLRDVAIHEKALVQYEQDLIQQSRNLDSALFI